eukprot:TRINITY_DN1597_c0_g2_i3.p1 TRINITY_DN1597_c0_g2~~TRINITY_DN1597_c0_g2_i3.p1  ORF type:complete len:102 (+),score=21.61 TRINITY_DN1597_c0_g2_i3:234-539(+)
MLAQFIQTVCLGSGNLRGLDQAMNACLSECVERVYSKDAAVNFIKLGIYMIRGDTIAIVGEIDDEVENHINFDAIKAPPMKPIVNQTNMEENNSFLIVVHA